MDDAAALRSALGWLELGLPEEALSELTTLPARERMRRHALELRLLAEMESRRWNAAADTGRLLCLKEPKEPRFFIHAAYCLHETGDTLAARDWLLRGPATLIEDPLFHYNIACYLAVLGDCKQAETHLERAFEMDESLRQTAQEDTDLAGLLDEG
jgi:Flp pilus assembly protein TadD